MLSHGVWADWTNEESGPRIVLSELDGVLRSKPKGNIWQTGLDYTDWRSSNYISMKSITVPEARQLDTDRSAYNTSGSRTTSRPGHALANDSGISHCSIAAFSSVCASGEPDSVAECPHPAYR